MMRYRITTALVLLGCALACCRTVAGGALDPAAALEDVDLKATQSFQDGQPAPSVAKVISSLIDPAKVGGSWRAGIVPRGAKKDVRFQYRLAFKKPIAIGAMMAKLDARWTKGITFHYLKADAPYPGDPDKEDHWEEIPATVNHGYYEITFPRRFETRALLCTEVRRWHRSVMSKWHFLKARLCNVTPYAIAQAEQGPYSWNPGSVIRGGSWRNAGAGEDKIVHRYPVSPVAPSWFILRWDDIRSVGAIRLRSSIGEFKLYAFIGAGHANPALAPKDEWERIKYTEAWKEGDARTTTRMLTFNPADTRAIKVRILETAPKGGRIVGIDEFTAWTDLEQAEVPPPPTPDPPPPLALPYEVDEDCEIAMVVEDSRGGRVRNLIAQVARKGGNNNEFWDLKDERGLPVECGTYRWKAIYAPPLELHYQFTPYPNVEMHSTDNRPWEGRPQDGWLANHANIGAVSSVGDNVYIAAGGTEGGHAFIETDLNGSKRWGTSRGADLLFTNGKTLFARSRSSISMFNIETRRFKGIIAMGGDPDRKGNLVGAAAKDDALYLAFSGPIPLMDNATWAANVDIENCLPELPEEVEREENYGLPATPQRDFISLFRLGGHIGGDRFTGGLLYLESTEGARRQQHILLSLKKPFPLGSLVFPVPEDPDLDFSISLLKPDAPYPPRLQKESDWQKIDTEDMLYWNCVPVPENTVTRALRITFAKATDELTKILEAEEPDPDDLGIETFEAEETEKHFLREEKTMWRGRIEGMRLLRARFKDLLADATVRVSSGKFDPETGEWDAQRTEPISPENPGVYVMEWEEPQIVRGLAVKEIDGDLTEIDVYEGPDDGAIDIRDDEHWRKVGSYRQKLRSFSQPSAGNNSAARYLGGMVDFGKDCKTRAVRLRVVKQWTMGRGPSGVRYDRGGTALDPTRCRVYGVAPLQYLGGEPPIDPLITKRLSVHDAETGEVKKETRADLQGPIAFNPAGELFTVRGTKVVRVNEETLEETDFVSDLKHPRLLDFDKNGRLYVYDHDPERRVVRVYDEKGNYLHSIGTPGPQKAGLWDPASLGEICAMSVDRADGIWMVYPHENPRRVIKFKTDGAYVKELLGNTHYGGGGTLDPYDKTRLYYKDVVFELDWEKGTSRIKNLLSLNYWEASPWWPGSFRHDMVPIMIDGRRYLVSVPLSHQQFQAMGAAFLHDEKTLTMRMVAAVGNAGAFPYINTNEFIKHLDGKPLSDFRFIWADRNGDGKPQIDEVTFGPKLGAALGRFDKDLGVIAGDTRYDVKEFLPDGTPVFEEKKMPFKALYRLNNGNYFRYSVRHPETFVNEVVSPEGKSLWTYPASTGVSGLYIPPWSPGYVTNQFGISGHTVAHAGDLGEFFVIHSNTGQMNIWTADGLLAGHVTLHTRDPRSRGMGGRFERGARLDGLTLGQEHFHHFFCKTEQDNKYYIIGGGDHTSVIEVKGIEKFKRLGAEFQVTPDVSKKTWEWEAARTRKMVFSRAPVIECAVLDPPPTLDGTIGQDEWGREEGWAKHKAEIPGLAEFRMGRDSKYLYLCWQTRNSGPLKNGGDDFRRYFKTGGGVDIKLQTDRKADPDRQRPAKGDVRLLITVARGKPVAVLYRPVAPDAPEDQAWKTTTPAAGTTAFDQVTRIRGGGIAFSSGENGYVVEVAIPLKALGLKLKNDLLLKMDWGVLSTEEGNITTARNYWANKMAVGTTDEPTEARLSPDLWGHVRFTAAKDKLDPDGLLSEEHEEESVEDMFEALPMDDDLF